MLKAIAVDDEKKALQVLSRIMKSVENVELAGTFTKPEEALAFLSIEKIDIAFLDIEMPGMCGLELAERIYDLKSDTEVIFTTAYNQYALQAFSVHAIGYLLKPIDPEEISTHVTDIMRRRRLITEHQTEQPGMIVKCLGEFNTFFGGAVMEKVSWRTTKAEEMFAFLLNRLGKPVQKEVIIDTLWPDADSDKGNNYFYVSTYYLRKNFATRGFPKIITNSRKMYRLNTGYLDCDLLEFEETIRKLKNGRYLSTDAIKKAVNLYQGPYLNNKDYEWAGMMRTWLENEYANMQFILQERYMEAADYHQAKNCLKSIIRHNPLSDEAYNRLIKAQIRAGDKASAKKTYNDYKTLLQQEFNMEPPDEISRLFKESFGN